MINLAGRVALVTGSSRGIGRSCALRLAEAGADVIVNYITSQTAAEQVAEEVRLLGRRAAIVKADVSEKDDVDAMMEFIGQQFGRLDILVSSAASGGFRPLMAATPTQFEAAMNTNARALLYLAQAGLPLLKQARPPAKILAISSLGSKIALPLYGLIGASKAALESLVRQLALELAPHGVLSNIVTAGLTQSDSADALLAFSDPTRIRPVPLQPQDVADAVLFLASSLANKMQGQTLTIENSTGENSSANFNSTRSQLPSQIYSREIQ